MSKNNEQWEREKQEILDVISKEASYRPVVPFFGAGISVSAGFPTIKFVIQYLAKVDFAIQFGVFEDRFPNIKEEHQSALKTYRRHPSKYLEDFGWPNLGQLNADIWDWLGRSPNDEDVPKELKKYKLKGLGRIKIWSESKNEINVLSEYLDRETKGLTKDEALKRKKALLKNKLPDLLAVDVTDGPISHIKKVFPRKLNTFRQLALRDHQQAIVQSILRKELAEHENGTTRALLTEWLEWKLCYFDKTDAGSKPPELLFGDWEMLLDRLCEGNFNLVDALFASFENGLNPTLSHRYLAFLQPKLGMQLLLTTNFDSLLEKAFQQEGIPLKVFDVHRDAKLPNAALLRRQLSLLKLHGSAYGLRLGERLKYQLEADARSNALEYIPSNALVLVMGFNGSERRIMQLLQAFVREREPKLDKPRLIWIQGPSEPGPLFNELIAESGGSVQGVKVGHLDTFLQELHFYVTSNSYQSSGKGYLTVPNRPLITELFKPNISHEQKRRPVHLCIADIQKGKSSSNWASLAGMAFVNSLGNGYTIIWIDLESHHTMEGILAEFFNRVRVIDPQAPSCTISNLDHNPGEAISKAIQRISDVFKRGRYVLVLDCVETFGRPQLVHHGIPAFITSQYEEGFKERIGHLSSFLNELIQIGKDKDSDNFYWDSYVVITADMPRLRHSRKNDNLPEPATYTEAYKLVSQLNCINKKDNNASIKYDHIYVHREIHNSSDEVNKYSTLISKKEYIPLNNPSEKLSPYWKRYDGNITEEKSLRRTIDRAENVLSLLSVLRSPTDTKTKIGEIRKKAVTEAFICLLSVFRRPRSLPLIRSIIERWGLREIQINFHDTKQKIDPSMSSHEAINALLQLIATTDKKNPVGVVLQNHEGGSVWLFREVFEATYDAMSEHLHRQYWKNTFGNESKQNESNISPAAAIMDGMLSISWQLFAARAYYVDVFLPTRDIQAFYEYLYHRVSATKTITLLITIIEKFSENGDKSICTELNQHCKELFLKYKKLLNCPEEKPEKPLSTFAWYALLLGVFHPIKLDDNDILDDQQLVRNFKLLRKNSLDTLLMAMTKNSLLFRTEAAPDTVLAWSEQLKDNMKEIKENAESSKTNSLDQEDQYVGIKETIDKLYEQFERLKSHALLSKMDYKTKLDDCSSKYQFDKKLDDFKKVKEELIILGNNFKTMQENLDGKVEDLIKLEKDIKKKEREINDHLNMLFDVARSLTHPCDHRAQGLTKSIYEMLLNFKSQYPPVDILIKNKQLLALELYGRSQFIKWPYWQPLLDHENSDVRNSQNEDESLIEAERISIRFEDLLRETTETSDDDAKYRSTALTIRARALYLRGYFPQAHHCLDLATTGLYSDRLDHWALISIVHVIRAELLAISAHEHYFSLSKHDQVLERFKEVSKIDQAQAQRHTQELQLNDLPLKFYDVAKILKPIADSSLKKIERAAQELRHAEKLLRNMAHQNIWLIYMEFGWAQIRVEQMLFDLESLFLSWHPLSVTQYLQKSGDLEQKILDAMQRLRNVLDIIPYRSQSWEEMQNSEEKLATRSMFQLECNVYKLWRQLFVVGAFYSSLLNCLYKGGGSVHLHDDTTVFDIAEQFIPCLTGVATYGSNALKYREQWSLWCIAMRFEHFGREENMKTFNLVNLQIKESAKSVSFRSAVIDAMREECPNDDKIEIMWRIRREPISS